MTQERIARASYRFNESPASVTAVTITDTAGRDAVDETVSSVTADQSLEVRSDAILTFSDDTGDSAAVTKLATVADALTPGTSAVESVAVGTDDTNPSQSDSSLGAAKLSKTGSRSSVGSEARVAAIAFRDEPSGQPYDLVELALQDTTGDTVTRVVFGAETKDDRVELRYRGGIDIR